MVFSAYLLENTILVLSQGGDLHYIFEPHRGVFAAFPKLNKMTNARGRGGGVGIGTLGID